MRRENHGNKKSNRKKVDEGREARSEEGCSEESCC